MSPVRLSSAGFGPADPVDGDFPRAEPGEVCARQTCVAPPGILSRRVTGRSCPACTSRTSSAPSGRERNPRCRHHTLISDATVVPSAPRASSAAPQGSPTPRRKGACASERQSARKMSEVAAQPACAPERSAMIGQSGRSSPWQCRARCVSTARSPLRSSIFRSISSIFSNVSAFTSALARCLSS